MAEGSPSPNDQRGKKPTPAFGGERKKRTGGGKGRSILGRRNGQQRANRKKGGEMNLNVKEAREST